MLTQQSGGTKVPTRQREVEGQKCQLSRGGTKVPTRQREVEGQKCQLSRGRWRRDKSADSAEGGGGTKVPDSADGGGGGKKVLTQQWEVEEGQKC